MPAPHIPAVPEPRVFSRLGRTVCTVRTCVTVAPQVDGALTYGEYDLGHFCALIERACADPNPNPNPNPNP